MAGAKTAGQAMSNAASAGWRLTAADLDAVNGLLTPVA
jgi:aryl-alcohol dehydrogenase-like predicted oxidoreductase